jgi:hypothetical protein
VKLRMRLTLFTLIRISLAIAHRTLDSDVTIVLRLLHFIKAVDLMVSGA